MKIVKLMEVDDLEKKAREFLIECYLLDKGFRHFCAPRQPAYCVKKETHFELFCIKTLAGFNMSEVLAKRKEKYLPYTEQEQLLVFKLLLT